MEVVMTADSLYGKLCEIPDMLDRYAYVTKHAEKFLRSYPVVVKHMCMNEYSRDALMKIIKLQEQQNIKNVERKNIEYERNNFFRIQAEYARLLAKEQKKGKAKCNAIYEQTLTELHENQIESERAVRKYDADLNNTLKRELITYITSRI